MAHDLRCRLWHLCVIRGRCCRISRVSLWRLISSRALDRLKRCAGTTESCGWRCEHRMRRIKPAVVMFGHFVKRTVIDDWSFVLIYCKAKHQVTCRGTCSDGPADQTASAASCFFRLCWLFELFHHLKLAACLSHVWVSVGSSSRIQRINPTGWSRDVRSCATVTCLDLNRSDEGSLWHLCSSSDVIFTRNRKWKNVRQQP